LRRAALFFAQQVQQQVLRACVILPETPGLFLDQRDHLAARSVNRSNI
jgi:hypothetical protein